MGLGRFNPFPLRLGGGKRPIELAHETLTKAYGENLDIDDSTVAGLEAYAEARITGTAWIASKRLANQMIPSKMLEGLPIWEDATGLVSEEAVNEAERRAAVAGKLRGLFNNATPDVRDACAELLGANFVGLYTTASADDTTYWPAINPGHPEMPWSTNSAIYFVEVTRAGLDQEVFLRKIGKVGRMLDDMIPAWMGFYVFTRDTHGSATGFILDKSLLDITGLS